MAIAYFIPDQAQLLAGQRASTGTGNRSSRRATPPNNRGHETNQLNSGVNRGYGTTINISVPTFNNTVQEPLGCWDFLTQVFCHALRFYHESSQLQPTVIQISVNFNSQTNTTATTATATDSNAADSVENDDTSYANTSTNLATATTNSPNADHKQRKFSKQKN